MLKDVGMKVLNYRNKIQYTQEKNSAAENSDDGMTNKEQHECKGKGGHAKIITCVTSTYIFL